MNRQTDNWALQLHNIASSLTGKRSVNSPLKHNSQRSLSQRRSQQLSSSQTTVLMSQCPTMILSSLVWVAVREKQITYKHKELSNLTKSEKQ